MNEQLIYAMSFAVGFLLGRTIILFIAARLVKIEGATFMISLLIALVISVISFIVDSIASEGSLAAWLPFKSIFATWLLIRFIGWFISLFIVKVCYSTTWIKAFLLWIMFTLLNTILSFALTSIFPLVVPLPLEISSFVVLVASLI